VPLGLPPGADSVRGFLVSGQNKKSFACFGFVIFWFARHSIINHRSSQQEAIFQKTILRA
jgi:hypothetical protein